MTFRWMLPFLALAAAEDCDSEGASLLQHLEKTDSQDSNRGNPFNFPNPFQQTGHGGNNFPNPFQQSGNNGKNICRNRRQMACDIFWNPLSANAELTKCGVGAVCVSENGQNVCKCQMGTDCSPVDGSCQISTPMGKMGVPNSGVPSQSPAGGPPMDTAFCTNSRSTPCKIGFIPFMDSNDQACGAGQNCEQAPNGQPMCKCIWGACNNGGCGR